MVVNNCYANHKPKYFIWNPVEKYIFAIYSNREEAEFDAKANGGVVHDIHSIPHYAKIEEETYGYLLDHESWVKLIPILKSIGIEIIPKSEASSNV